MASSALWLVTHILFFLTTNRSSTKTIVHIVFFLIGFSNATHFDYWPPTRIQSYINCIIITGNSELSLGEGESMNVCFICLCGPLMHLWPVQGVPVPVHA